MPKKSSPHTRDESITLNCNWCGKTFHPWRRKDSDKTKFCSNLCRGQALMAGINSHGITPAEPMPIRVPGLIVLDSDEEQPQPHDTSKSEAMGAQWCES